MIDGIIDAVSIPVMAKARIGHFVEAQVLQALGVDYVDESEVLHAGRLEPTTSTSGRSPCRSCRGDQPGRGAAPDHRGRRHDPLEGRGRHRRRRPTRPPTCARSRGEITPADARCPRTSCTWRPRELQAPYELVARGRRGPASCRCVLFTAGGIATPADAAMMMQLGAEGVLRRLGHLQVRQPGPARRGHRQGHHLLTTTPTCSPRSPAGSARPWSASTSTTIPQPHRLAERGW